MCNFCECLSTPFISSIGFASLLADHYMLSTHTNTMKMGSFSLGQRTHQLESYLSNICFLGRERMRPHRSSLACKPIKQSRLFGFVDYFNFWSDYKRLKWENTLVLVSHCSVDRRDSHWKPSQNPGPRSPLSLYYKFKCVSHWLKSQANLYEINLSGFFDSVGLRTPYTYTCHKQFKQNFTLTQHNTTENWLT